jgi:thiamine-monophosphate kinase
MTAIGEFGEFAFIDRIRATFGTDADLLVGAGDDCAVFRAGDSVWCVTTDMVVESVHFLREANAEDVGWKAMTAAISDIGAMGARPRFALVSMASPPDRDLAYLDALYAGLNDAAREHGAIIIGGDTTRSPEGLYADVCVLGEANGGRYVTRGGAQHGDYLAITGWPGRSRAGLDCLQRDLKHPALIDAHLRPRARIAEGQWLARQPGVRAMMDVSDGLAQDAGHLAESSGLGVAMTSASIAVDSELALYCAEAGVSIPDVVFAGGEDYELLFGFDPAVAGTLLPAFRREFGLPVFIVGQYDRAFEGVRIDGLPPTQFGFDHFRKT